MNRLRFVLVSAVAGALSFAGLPAQQPAPRSYSSYFFFGDSLTDIGNTFALTGSPPSPPYFSGRVSNGPTYAEYLRSGLAAHATAPGSVRTNLVFAFAGATAAPGSAVPNLSQQLALFQSRGITPGGNDLFVVLAGANDLLNTVSVPAGQNLGAMQNTGVAASQAVANTVQSLLNLGARHVVVLNLPDISKTARFTTGSGAPAAALIQQGSLAFNNDIRGRIAALALPAGANVTVFDLGAVFGNILGNASRFGFTVTNQEYLGVLLGGGNPGDVNNYIFWDGIHPTTKTHSILAAALTEVLNPEFVLGSSAVQGNALLLAADAGLDALDERLDVLRTGNPRSATGAFVTYALKDGSLDFSGYRHEFDYDVRAFTAGFDHRFNERITVGLALVQEETEVTLKAGAGSFKTEGVSGAVYAQWRGGALFADASIGVGSVDVQDIVRTTGFGGLQTTATTDGERQTAALRFGGNFGGEGMRVSPFAGVRFIQGDLDGYTEAGVAGLNLAHADQSAEALTGVVGVTATWQASAAFGVNLSAVYQGDLRNDDRPLNGRLADTTAPQSTAFVDDGLGDSIKLGARVGGVWAERWGWGLGAQADIRDDGDTAMRYSLTVTLGM